METEIDTKLLLRPSTLGWGCFPEIHATDSYQNVLFPFLDFRLYTGHYPTHVTLITHEFKRRRFEECHFPAIGLTDRSEVCVNLIGINPPEHVTPLRTLVSGEERSGIGLWRRDLYGVGKELADKRLKRGWSAGKEKELFVGVGLEDVVERLVTWDGGREGSQCFEAMDELPWNTMDNM
jgi:hypothetical protein